MVQIANEKGYNRFEWMHQKMDGTPFWVDVTLTKVDHGDKSTIYSIWRDIDEKKKTLLALEQSERNYREIFNSSSEMIIVSDSESMKTIDINETALCTYGYTKEEALELTIEDISSGVAPYSREVYRSSPLI